MSKNTATAGTGGSITSGEAKDSICPRNWKLPTSNNTNPGSFHGLLEKYGLQSSVTGSTNPATGQPYNIAAEPLFFVRSGDVYPAYSSATRYQNAGFNGYYWSSAPYSNGASSYLFSFYNSGVNPSDGSARLNGFPLRCLAR